MRLKLLALQRREFLRVLRTRRAPPSDASRASCREFPCRLLFLWQPWQSQPERRGVEPGHGFRLDDEILEALVHACPGGWGRWCRVGRRGDVFCYPSEALAGCARRAHLLPAFEHFRLVLGQSAFMEKLVLGIDRGFQVRRHLLGFSQR